MCLFIQLKMNKNLLRISQMYFADLDLDLDIFNNCACLSAIAQLIVPNSLCAYHLHVCFKFTEPIETQASDPPLGGGDASASASAGVMQSSPLLLPREDVQLRKSLGEAGKIVCVLCG